MSLLTAVAPALLSGLFGRSQARAQQKAYATRIRTTVADAREAGIHPLEAIRAGAANSVPDAGPRLISDTALQNAFDRVTDVIAGRRAQADEQKAVSAEITRINQDIMARGASPVSFGAGAGVVDKSPRVQSPSNWQAGSGPTNGASWRNGPTPNPHPEGVGLGTPAEPIEGNTSVTNPLNEGPDGLPRFTDPHNVDADAYAARYGEGGEWIGGLRNASADTLYNRTLRQAALQMYGSVTRENLFDLHDRVSRNPRIFRNLVDYINGAAPQRRPLGLFNRQMEGVGDFNYEGRNNGLPATEYPPSGGTFGRRIN